MKTGLRGLPWIFPLLTLLVCSCDVHKKLAQLHFNEAMSKYYHGDYTNSLADLTAAIAQNPKLGVAYAYRGYDLMMARKYVDAIKDLDQALSLGQADTSTFIYRGYCYQELGDNTVALTNYTEAIRLAPGSSQAYKFRGALRTNLREYDGALEDLDQAESLNPKDGEVLGYRAALHLARQEFEDGVTNATRAIALNPKDDYALEQRGYCKLYLRDYAGAVDDFNAAIALNVYDADYLADRGSAKLMAGDIPAAEADLTQATMLCPTNATALNGQAHLKIKNRDLAGAAAAFTKIAGLYPGVPETLHQLGCIQGDLGQYEPALKNLRRAVELDPKNYYARYRIWIIRTRLGEAAAASVELKADLATRGDDNGHPWELCISRFLAGDVTETNLIAQAAETAKRPTDVSGQQCEAYYYAGMKRLLAGDKPGAIALLEKCVATKEDNFVEYSSAQVELDALNKLELSVWPQ